MKRYNTIEEIPEWGRETVVKLCARGIIKGRGAEPDAEGYPTDLDLSDDMLRMLVWNDRAGVYDPTIKSEEEHAAMVAEDGEVFDDYVISKRLAER